MATQSNAIIKSIVESFLNRIDYKVQPRVLDPDLLQATLESIEFSGIKVNNESKNAKRINLSVAFADLVYPHHSLELKVHIAIFTWLSFCVDDHIFTPNAITRFQECFCEGLPQQEKSLELYAKILRGMYRFYDPVTASFIIESALAFVNSCILEARDEFETMPESAGGEAWAYYFRNKNGMADAYGYFIFPKHSCQDISSYLQAIPDITIFINLVNDILSFYKEHEASETKNYIHTRAKYEDKTDLQILEDITNEVVISWIRISKVLKGQGNCQEAWRTYYNGYIALHKSQDRYRLNEIGLGEAILWADPTSETLR